MAASPPVPRPTWSRRAPGWVFALFFVSLIALTYIAVYFYNVNDLVSAGYLAGLASVVPAALVVLVYYLVPLWAIAVPLSAETVATVVAGAARGAAVAPVEERTGGFGRCVAVVRLDVPACKVGWYPEPGSDARGAIRAQSMVVLRPQTRDRKAMAAFRDALARSLLAAEPRPAA